MPIIGNARQIDPQTPRGSGNLDSSQDAVDTNAEDTNVSGNIQMNPAELAASTDFTDRPM